MAGSINLQADVGNLSLSSLSSVRSLLGTLSMDDVQPVAMLQVQDIGSLFHASGRYACTVSDELQRFSSYRLEKLAVTVGWRRGDAASLLAQSAGGQAVALLALFLRNTFDHRKAGEILFKFSRDNLPEVRQIASIKQLAEVCTKVGEKLASMGYGNFLAEQVTKLRLTYLQSNLAVPNDLLEDLAEETIVGILSAISRAQREADRRTRITGTRGVGHIMALLLLLCADDVTIAVENIIIYSGTEKSIFLNVLTSHGIKPSVDVQVETILNTTQWVSLPIQPSFNKINSSTEPTFLLAGYLAARLDIALIAQCNSLKGNDLAEDCCNFIWNVFQLETASRAWAALGTQPQQRMQTALLTMFDVQTWLPRNKDPKTCLEAITNRMQIA
ncbi:MAG: hypothetical protein Q9225_007425 [Loekoesia sp. 1 TL-2023]